MPKKNPMSIKDLDRILKLTELDSLDAPIKIGDENTTLGETLGDDKEVRFQRLKNFLDAVATTKKEKKILDLMYQGLSREDIRDELGMSPASLRNILNRLRKKCRQHGLNINNKKK